MLKFIKYKKTDDVVVSHRHATIALTLDRRQQHFLFSNDDRVPQNILLSIAKNVILRSKRIFLNVGNAVLGFLRIWNQDRQATCMYEPTQ